MYTNSPTSPCRWFVVFVFSPVQILSPFHFSSSSLLDSIPTNAYGKTWSQTGTWKCSISGFSLSPHAVLA